MSARLRYGRRGETTSPHGAGAPAVPASLRLMWCAVAPLQARQPCGPFRSVTPAGCASGGSKITRNRPGLGETVAPQKMVRGERRQARPGLRQAGAKRRNTLGACVMCRRNVQQAENWIKCHLWGGFAIFHRRCLWRISANRERATGRERGLGSQP
jgi:hypothetical protein